MEISKELEAALVEYKAALRAAPYPMEAGWIDDFQRRRERVAKATNTLLEVAANELIQ